MIKRGLLLIGLAAFTWIACGDDEPIARGVGASCVVPEDCTEEGQACLTNFKGGYCGIQGCTTDGDCPVGSRCVTHENINYCFLTCVDKSDCNALREVEIESNCSSNLVFVEGQKGKVCVPPSGA